MWKCLRKINTKNWRLSRTWKRRQAMVTMVMVAMAMDMVITAMVTVIMVMGMDMVITMEDTITMAMVGMVGMDMGMDTTATMDTEATIKNMFLLQILCLSPRHCLHFSLKYISLL